MNKKVIAILAVDEEFWIWKWNDIPWKSDLKNFKEITTFTQDSDKQNALLMGRKTWESIPEKFRPFSGRKNSIISNQKLSLPYGVDIFLSVENALFSAQNDDKIETIFIIGWASIYNYVFEKNLVDEIYLTNIPWTHECDTFVEIDLSKYTSYFQDIINVWEEKYLFSKYKK